MATSLAFQGGQTKVSKRVEKELHNTKVVVRRLPPDITETQFFEFFSDTPEYSYFYFTAGDPTFGELTTSRAYFSFIEESSIIPFRDKYDGIVLESAKGYKYRAVIEFAPYQGIPKRTKKKPDGRIGTIEQDQDYSTFSETAHVKKEPPTMTELAAYAESLAATKVQEVQMTPLLSYINERRSGRSSKRSKTSESKKKRSKDPKATKEPRSKGDEIAKSSSGGSKDWTGKSKKEKSGKKYDVDTTSSHSSTSVEGKGATTGGSEKSKERGKSRDGGRGKSWKESQGWRDETSWDGGSEYDKRRGEGIRKERSSGKMQKNEDGHGRGVDQGEDKDSYREKKSSRRVPDEERRQKSSSVRNRDRPDQPIFSARSRSRGDINHASKDRDGSSDGQKAAKEHGEVSRSSSRSEGWKRREQVNGEKPKFRGDKDDYYEGGGSRYRSGNKRGRGRDAGYNDGTSARYYDK